MSCKHGNHEDACDICDEVAAAYESGLADRLAAPAVANGAAELPPLPKAGVTTDTHIDGKGYPAFTAEQMQAYGQACIASAQQAAPNALTDADILAQ